MTTRTGGGLWWRLRMAWWAVRMLLGTFGVLWAQCVMPKGALGIIAAEATDRARGEKPKSTAQLMADMGAPEADAVPRG